MTTINSREDNLEKIRIETINEIKNIIKPKLLLILSGKRKSGKDFIENLLLEKYPNKILSFRISSPIKYEFSRINNLNFNELLTSSNYKENYRKKMIDWSESIRKYDENYFLRLSILDSYKKSNDENEKLIWILNDARRLCDLNYFYLKNEINLDDCKILKIRIKCNDNIRIKRGWIYTEGIDDQTSECGLDHYNDWNFIIENNGGDKNDLLNQLSIIFNEIDSIL